MKKCLQRFAYAGPYMLPVLVFTVYAVVKTGGAKTAASVLCLVGMYVVTAAYTARFIMLADSARNVLFNALDLILCAAFVLLSLLCTRGLLE